MAEQNHLAWASVVTVMKARTLGIDNKRRYWLIREKEQTDWPVFYQIAAAFLLEFEVSHHQMVRYSGYSMLFPWFFFLCFLCLQNNANTLKHKWMKPKKGRRATETMIIRHRSIRGNGNLIKAHEELYRVTKYAIYYYLRKTHILEYFNDLLLCLPPW